MANFNKVILMGNLCKDPELKYTPQGIAVMSNSLAINRKYKSGEEMKKEVTFISIVIWGKIAEVVHQYCKKGSPLMVEGRLQTRTWEDTEGKKNYKTEVVVENIQLLGGKKEDSGPKQEETQWLEEEK